MKAKIWDVVLLILKIVLPLVLLIPLVFFSCGLIESRISDLQHIGDDGYHSGYMFYYFATTLLLIAVNVGVLLLTGVARLIAHLCKSSPLRDRHVRFFKRFFWAPLVNQLLYVLVLIVLSFFG